MFPRPPVWPGSNSRNRSYWELGARLTTRQVSQKELSFGMVQAWSPSLQVGEVARMVSSQGAH